MVGGRVGGMAVCLVVGLLQQVDGGAGCFHQAATLCLKRQGVGLPCPILRKLTKQHCLLGWRVPAGWQRRGGGHPEGMVPWGERGLGGGADGASSCTVQPEQLPGVSQPSLKSVTSSRYTCPSASTEKARDEEEWRASSGMSILGLHRLRTEPRCV